MEHAALRDAIRGSLIGGAAGDALGYVIEFLKEDDIFARYGKDGITAYRRFMDKGPARISDDTQMTLFTAEGLLHARTGTELPRVKIAEAYRNWYLTQMSTYEAVKGTDVAGHSRLMRIPELFSLRAPGNTCLAALRAEMSEQTHPDDYLAHPCNNSKGCGGVMRVAPIALDPVLRSKMTTEQIDLEAAQAAAITHGHSLGYMPCALLNHIISRIVFPEGARKPLPDIVREACSATEALFRQDPNLPRLLALVNDAIERAGNGEDDLSNIHCLGEGWVAEETLAIAIYCALRYRDDFSKALIVSVNHKGDSDSTGAVTGNILGAWVGYDAIDEKWKTDLELHDTILAVADALASVD